jgi:hypothetical protein
MIPLHDDNPTTTTPFITVGAAFGTHGGGFLVGLALIPWFRHRHLPLYKRR